MDNCIFCKIVKGEIPCDKVYENDSTLAFLDINPVYPGHTLIVPKKHYSSLIEISEKDLGEVMKTVKQITPGILKSTNVKAFNLFQNNGKEAGQDVFHVHFHLIPRKEGDGLDIKLKTLKLSSEEMKKTAQNIKKELSKFSDKNSRKA